MRISSAERVLIYKAAKASKLTMTAILCKGGVAFARELIDLYSTRKESE